MAANLAELRNCYLNFDSDSILHFDSFSATVYTIELPFSICFKLNLYCNLFLLRYVVNLSKCQCDGCGNGIPINHSTYATN